LHLFVEEFCMRRVLAWLTLGFATLASPLHGQAKVHYEQYALPNGLRVYLAEDHSTPVVTVDVWYDVGSRNEQPGHTGLAHLFEHLMYRGSEHVADGQHYQLLDAAGGETNGSANEERTAFFETLPSNRLALGLWLEADRMRSLKITEQIFSHQRDQTKQERQSRVDNQPYGAAFLDGITAAFDSAGCFAYAHSVMGSVDELDGMEVSEIQSFYKLHYVPNRATLVVAGDFDGPEARRLIQTYFADIARGTATVPDAPCKVNFAAGEKSQQWQDGLANLPAVIVSYRVPPHSDADARALQLLTQILGQGDGSRLHRALVNGDHSAAQAASGLESRGGPGLLYAYAIANQGVTPAATKQALATAVARLSTDVTQAELDRAKIQYRTNGTLNRQTSYQLAEEVQHFAHFHPSVDEINTDLDRFGAVTLEDLRRAAAKYLVPANSTVLVVLPAGGPPASDGGHQHEEKQ
jgi:predicted Zn-dependent peptidase